MPLAGVKVTVGLTFFFFLGLPVALTVKVAGPWVLALAVAGLTPVPVRLTVPGLGRLSCSEAVPFFLFVFTAWMENALLGSMTAVTFASAPPTIGEKSAKAPSARSLWFSSGPGLAGLGNVHALAAVAMAKAGETRTMVRGMRAVTMPGLTDVATLRSRDELLVMAATLTAADERVDEERMSPLDHEALWWQVYEKLAPAAAVASVRKMPH